MKKVLPILILLAMALPASAACTGSGLTWSCAAGSTTANIQSAISSATDGATITLAAGSYTLGWVKFSNSKGATLICASVGACTINTGGATVFGGDIFGGTNNFFYRISGFVIDGGNGTPSGLVAFDDYNGSGPVTMSQIRIDHNTFQNMQAGGFAIFFGHNNSTSPNGDPYNEFYGVIDHNTFQNSVQYTALMWIGIVNPSPSLIPASQMGTANNMFFEDNTINFTTMPNASNGGCSDGWGGAAYVIRHNTSLNCLWAFHAVTHGGGVANVEFYNNSASVNNGSSGAGVLDGYRLFHHQGSGEITVFNNSFTAFSGKNSEVISVLHYRDYLNSIDGGLPQCDGTQSIDGNRATTATNRGYPCWNQPGRDFKTQTLHPMYTWNNAWSDTHAQVPLVLPDNGGSPDYYANHMQFGREANDAVSASAQSSATSPFNGTTGTGFGTIANRPTTCTTNAEPGAGVGYFATDVGSQGTMYTCLATNTWTVYYAPYTYPHPLVSSTATLGKITILPPTTGYYLATNTSTAQLTPQCFDTTATLMTCPSLTWYSGDTTNVTVNGTGLVTGTGAASVTTGVYITAYAPSKSATVTAYAITSNAITVTATNTFAVNDPVTLAGFGTSTFLNNQTVIVTAATGSTFTAQFIHSNTSVTESGNAKLFVLGRGGVLMPTYTPSGLVTSVGDQVVIGAQVLVSARDSTSRPLGDFCAWTSSDPTKATVNYIGEVTGVAVGSVTMTCTIGANTSTGTFNVTNPTSTSTNWYVRPGGGTRWDAAVTSGQCNGKFDVDYPGSGTNQNCAFKEVMYLFTDETSSSVCTPAPGPGDTAIVRGGPYYINRRQNGTQWVGCQNGTIAPPNGPTGQPFRLLGENWASPTVGRNNPGNATKLISPASVAPPFSIGEQNIDIESFDINLQQDCNPGLNNLSFACPSGNNHPFIFISNNFASNITIKNVRGHGATTFWTGVPGLNVQFINTFSEYNFLDGYNFDDPFGDSQYRTDGFTGIGIEAYCAGCTEEQPKPVTSVSRSGGNITVVFPSTSVVNYVAPAGANPGTNLVLTGMTPSDLNGTYPVNTVTFNQQTVSITGGSVIADPDGSVPFLGTYTTSSPATFRIGDFVNITGLTPSFVNGTYEVSNVLSNEFQIWVSPVSRPGWTTATITGTGSASTAVTVVATAAGSTENATVVGTAGHVFQNHRMFDQFTGAFANGDCIGSGANTIGDWSFNGFYFQDCLQDGLDDLHGSVHSVTVLNGYVEGAEGAPVKLGNADFVTMKGNVLVSNGAKLIAFDPNLAPDANQYVSTTYRSGDVFVMSSHPWSREIISNNSWISGGFNVVWDDFCTQAIGCTTPLAGGYYIAQNNIFRGFTDTNNSVWNSSLPTVYFAEGGNVPWLFQYNMSSSTRTPPSGGTGNQWSTDPLIVTPIPNITTFAGELSALSNNLNLTGSSPAIGSGLQNFGVPTSDNVGTAMPNPPPIGALNPAGSVTPTAQFFGTGKFFGQQTIP